MMRIYILGLVAAMIFGAYWAGGRISDARCAARGAVSTGAAQRDLLQISGGVNVETLRRGVADIRDVLRQKYTIVQ